MTQRTTNTTRRSLLRSTTISLVGATAGCIARSTDSSDLPDSDDTLAVPVTNLSTRSDAEATPWQSDSRGSATPQSTATDTPAGSPTREPTTRTETQPSTSTQTQSRSTPQRHPYLTVGSGTGKFDLDYGRYPVMGFDRAPIDLLYWSDYLCDYCKRFATSIHPKLIKQEVKRGDVRFVFLELPNIGQNSWPAALLSKAVWKTVSKTDPALFWEWHQTVFERQGKPESGWADSQALLDIAAEVGIDSGAVKRSRDTNKQRFSESINAAIDAADRVSIPGTPAFHLYNRNTGKSKTILGAQPISVYRSAISQLK